MESKISVSLITKFDPWNSRLCTCPKKLTFNVYTGCDHGCVYCYASSYIPNFEHCRPKKNVIPRLEREVPRLRGEIISISNSSDPYPNLERKNRLTRQCLKVIEGSNCRIQIITKSDLVLRDIDILMKIPSMISLTITTDDDEVAKMIEPNAPTPSQRLKTAAILVSRGIPVSVRIDPIIPLVNDNPKSLVKKLAELGVRQVTCSTYKAKADNWRKLSEGLPAVSEELRSLYFDRGERISGSYYLPRDMRLSLMEKMRALATESKMEFGACREGFKHLNTASCDGSWLINESSNR